AALGLARAGRSVAVFEQAPELGEVGAGLSLPPNATKILARLGLGEPIAALADTPDRGLIRNGKSGAVLSDTPFAEPMREAFGAPYYQMLRPRLHELLVQALEEAAPGAVRLGAEVLGVDVQADRAVLRLAGDETVGAAAVIGADGVRSKLREDLFGRQPARFTGYVAWRATVDMAALPDSLGASQSVVWVGEGRQFVHYPIDQGRKLNVVAFAGGQTWDVESWTEPADPAELQATFAGWSDEVGAVLAAIAPAQCFKWALFDREPLARWTQGRVALLGDAAHPMLPFLGQGAAMAIEDAYVLANLLSQNGSVFEALAGYEVARAERAAWVLLESRAAGARFQAQGSSQKTFDNDQAMRMNVLFSPEPDSLTSGWRAPA
ncbi:MAG: FAD-dependent monooxygenase, partial [Pseudomonadota bacterium]